MPDEMAASRNRGASPPTPTLRDVLAVIFRQRRLVVVTFVAVLGTTLLYGWLRPSYEAEMKVLIRRGRVDAVVTPESHSPAEFARSAISEEELNSEAELLHDEDLLRTVVEENALTSTNRLRWLPWKEDSQEVRTARAVRGVARRLRAEPIRRTSLIAVSYVDSDPRQAGRVLRSLARLYVEKHKQVHRSGNELPFFEQQTERSRRQLDEAESRVLDFSRDRGVVAAAMERDLAVQRVGEIESVYQQAQVAIVGTIHRIRALESRMRSLPERSTSQIRTADNPQLLENLKAKLLELELKRTELLTKYDPGYRLVQEVEEQIDQTKSAIAKEELAPVREETTEKDPNYEWSKAELGKSEVELIAAEARAKVIGGELVIWRTKARTLGEEALRQQDLLTSMKTAEETYLLYAKKSEQARMSDALDERSIVNVAIVESPSVPVLPKYSAWTFFVIGLLAAGTTSTALAFAADYLDPAFRTPEEVVAYLNVPVLASLPREAA
jgi:uncharacterized protein involved in exopolysaccharide biosynthesis